MNILITGGTGFVGKTLVKHLIGLNHRIYLISRGGYKEVDGVEYIPLPAESALFSSQVMSDIDAIVNLAGHNISAGRWNPQVKELILNSRLRLTRQLVESIERNKQQQLPYPTVMINASAVGYYGTHAHTTFHEASPNGQGFLALVCKQWEQEAQRVEAMGVRLVILRLGLVLGPGGALEKMALPYRFCFGGYLGDGKQWCSWIHQQDVIQVISQALQTTDYQGIYNLCSPQPVTMSELARAIANTLHKKSWTRMPAFLTRLMFGEMAEELLLNGQRVLPQRLQELKYRFQYPDIQSAIEKDLTHK